MTPKYIVFSNVQTFGENVNTLLKIIETEIACSEDQGSFPQGAACIGSRASNSVINLITTM